MCYLIIIRYFDYIFDLVKNMAINSRNFLLTNKQVLSYTVPSMLVENGVVWKIVIINANAINAERLFSLKTYLCFCATWLNISFLLFSSGFSACCFCTLYSSTYFESLHFHDIRLTYRFIYALHIV